MFWNSSWKFCELAPHTYGCLLVVQEALFLEVCSFSHPAFFCPTLLEGPVEASPSSASWAGQSISSAPPRCLLGRWTFLALELFPFSWAQKDCVDKNVLNGSKQPNICFCILSCFVLLQLITHTHTHFPAAIYNSHFHCFSWVKKSQVIPLLLRSQRGSHLETPWHGVPGTVLTVLKAHWTRYFIWH